MEAKHTPGPWAIDWNVSRLDVFSADAATLVASLRRSAMSSSIDETARANARLIAAAPDLLEALQQLVACHDEPTCPALDVARAAIAKATSRAA